MTAAVAHSASLVPRARLGLGRIAAALAVGSAVVHLLLVDGGSLASVAMVAMAAACLPCARHLWRSPTGAVWATTAALDAAMLAVHLQMLAPSADGHAHHAAAPGPGVLMWLGLALVSGQLLVAGLAALRR